MNIEIRPAVPSDAAQIHAFITELAVYERAAHEVGGPRIEAAEPEHEGHDDGDDLRFEDVPEEALVDLEFADHRVRSV